MNRLTSNKKTSEMGMYELSHNCMFIKDGEAWYRDFDREISLRNMVREIMEQYEGEYDEQLNDDELLDTILFESLQYPAENGISAFIAIFNMLAWSLADLRERLKKYEDLEEQGRLLGLPCKIGDTVWDIDYDKPHSYEVTGFSFGKLEEDFYDDVEAEKFDDDIIFYFRNSSGGISGYSAVCELGKAMFLTREEAEKALKEGQSKDLMEEECL